MQWTGFGYHATPFHSFILLGLVWASASPATGGLALIALATQALIFTDFAKRGAYRSVRPPELAETFDAILPGEKVAVFSTNMFPFFPIVMERNAVWQSRYPHYLFLPGSLAALNHLDCAMERALCERHRALLSRSRLDAVEATLSGPADILIFDLKNVLVDNSRFSVVDFLSEDTRFAQELETYCETFRSNVYLVMRRSAEGCGVADED